MSKRIPIRIPMTKITCPKNSHAPKNVNVPQQKINAPPNFTTTKIFDMSIHNYQIVPITTPLEKIPT